MAKAVKRTIRRQVPENATIVIQRGKKVAQWPGRGGKVRSASLVETEDGPRIEMGDNVWWAMWNDERGKVRLKRGFSDRDMTEALARKMADLARSRKLGLTDAGDEHRAAEGRRPLEKHVADYRVALEAKGSSARHIDQTIGYIDAVRKSLGWLTLRNIRADALAAHLAERKKHSLAQPPRAPRGRSPRRSLQDP